MIKILYSHPMSKDGSEAFTLANFAYVGPIGKSRRSKAPTPFYNVWLRKNFVKIFNSMCLTRLQIILILRMRPHMQKLPV